MTLIIRMNRFVVAAILVACMLSQAVQGLIPKHAAQSFTTRSSSSFGTSSSSSSFLLHAVSVENENAITDAKTVLYRAAESKTEESDTVVEALLNLEKLMRNVNKENNEMSVTTLDSLSGYGGGSWQLVFTTGTIDTQKKTGRINYFPIKAVQSFNKDTSIIENGIYIGDFCVLKFQGDFDWTLQKSGVTKLTFDFTSIKLFNTFDITLKAGEAANLGAKSGLGSKNNVELEKQGKRAFFNWISADDKIATARGGGGGLALWKRIDYEGEQ